MHKTATAPPRKPIGPSGVRANFARKTAAAVSGLLAGSLLLLAAPAQAGTIFATAYDSGDYNYFFKISPTGAGGEVSQAGLVYLNAQRTGYDGLPLTAMTAVNGQLKATSVSAGGSFDYYSNITPLAAGGAYTSNAGDVTEQDGGAQLNQPVATMAALSGTLFGTSWNGTLNYFYEMHEQSDGTGAYGTNFSGVSLGQGGRDFGYQIETMAEFAGQLYGTAYDGAQSLFFKINRNDSGYGAWVDMLGPLTVGGSADTDHIDAMVGTGDGLFATSWNAANSYNYFFRIMPNLGGTGGYETDTGIVTVDGAKMNYRINTLAYLPTGGVGVDVPGVPEPATWALMITGFGAIGATLRQKRRTALTAC